MEPVNRHLDEMRQARNERASRLAASYPEPDIIDLLDRTASDSVNDLSQFLFEHPLHEVLGVMLGDA